MARQPCEFYATGTASPTPPAGSLCAEAGRDPHDRALTDLVGELSMRAGDVIYTQADERHWHGAAPDRFMTHLSITEAVLRQHRPPQHDPRFTPEAHSANQALVELLGTGTRTLARLLR
jgi:hypothetical protein